MVASSYATGLGHRQTPDASPLHPAVSKTNVNPTIVIFPIDTIYIPSPVHCQHVETGGFRQGGAKIHGLAEFHCSIDIAGGRKERIELSRRVVCGTNRPANRNARVFDSSNKGGQLLGRHQSDNIANRQTRRIYT